MKLISVLILLLYLAVSPRDVAAQVPTVIRVEVDWMADATHSHKPTVAEMEAVRQMFACHGINFIYLIDDSLQHFNVIRRNPADSNVAGIFNYNDNNNMDTYGAIKAARFDNNGGGWHYCVFGHQYQASNYTTSGSSGYAELPGDDFIVTLGAFNPNTGTSWDRAATFAHELGHNLGLGHAGNMDPTIVGTNTPVVPSIMTYFFQLRGVKSNLVCQRLVSAVSNLFKDLDYSNGIGCTVNEALLDENVGIGISKVDWNCDGRIDSIFSQDISNNSSQNGWCGAVGPIQTLSDFDEWSNIHDVTSATYAAHSYESKEVSCISYEEYIRYRGSAGSCPQPAVGNEACRTAKMYYVRPGIGSGNGRCTVPFLSFSAAYSSVINGDILYFAAGNYPTGGPVILNRACILAGPGGAVIGIP